MTLPWYARVVVRVTYPSAERREVAADLAAEFAQRRAADGAFTPHLWLLREVLTSTPALLRRGVWRGMSGFESEANAMRPGGAPFESIVMDARYACRRLRSRPTYAILAVLTLALGVGGGSAIYGITRAFLVDALPYADESKLVILSHQGDWTEEAFVYLRDKTPGFSSMTAYRLADATLTDGDRPAQMVHHAVASSELFSVLGVKPLVGRAFAVGEDAVNAPPVAVISFDFWQELGGDASVLGKRIVIDGAPRTVVGVMPRGFWFPDPTTRMWVPGPFDPANRVGNYALIGRVAPGGGSVDASLAQFSRIIKERFTGQSWPGWLQEPVTATPLRDDFFGPLRPALLATLVAMGFIMLIACANVAALTLGQVEGRTAELAVRAALGADRLRITQQVLLEALVIGALAAVAGGGIATVTFRVLVLSLPLGALAGRVALDYRIFAAALAIAMTAAVLIAMVPITALWRGHVRDSLVRARTSGIGGGSRVAGALVVGEVALALLMVAGAGLLVRSVTKLYDIDPGLSRNSVAVVDIVTPANLSMTQRQRVLQSLIGEIGSIAGVKSVSMTQKLPLRGRGWTSLILIPSHPETPRTTTTIRLVAPKYFETMGIRLVRGREITSEDVAGREPAIVINEALAATYFGTEDPIGKEVFNGFGHMGRVVGIVSNVAEASLTDSVMAVRYMSYQQIPFMVPPQTLVIRTTNADAARQLATIQLTINRVAPTVAIQGATTMASVIDRAVGPARQIMMLLGLLTSLALILGSIGIYGTIAQFVTRRGREWGIRMALGLSPSLVIRHVITRGTRLVAMGVAIGLTGMLVMPRLVKPFLYGVTAADPVAMLMAICVLVSVGVAASLIPALRAARVDPARALREQ